MKTAIIILAAGAASRMGQPKQLMPFGGKPLLRHAAETALQTGCDRVTVVLGAHAELVRTAVEGLPVECVFNADWAGGMGSSIHAGVAAAAEFDAVILTLADQPLLTAAVYNELIQRQILTGKPIVAAEYSGTVGVPVLFTRERFADLLGLGADQGCKGLILKAAGDAIRVPCPEAEADIDTPGDLERISAIMNTVQYGNRRA